jgi:hypothetical protein
MCQFKQARAVYSDKQKTSDMLTTQQHTDDEHSANAKHCACDRRKSSPYILWLAVEPCPKSI